MQVNIQIEIDSEDNVHNLLQIIQSMNYISQAQAFDSSGKLIEKEKPMTAPTSLETVGFGDTNFRDMSITDFYKKVNAWNLDQNQNNLIEHETLKTEIASW